MINLKKFFQSNPHLLSISKSEKELLERFVSCKADYEKWNAKHQRMTFRFYLPAAIDFCYDGSKLFTAFFKKGLTDAPVLHEIKMSEANYAAIRSTNWKPFKEVMLDFMQTVEEKHRVIYVQETKPFQDYVSICKEAPAGAKEPSLSNAVSYA